MKLVLSSLLISVLLLLSCGPKATPTPTPMPTLTPTPTPTPVAEPNAEQIKTDLIGKELIAYGSKVWTFAAPSEFQELNIKNKQMLGELIEYDVSMRLRDLLTNTEYLADALVVYKKADGKWQLISIVAKLWRYLGIVR